MSQKLISVFILSSIIAAAALGGDHSMQQGMTGRVAVGSYAADGVRLARSRPAADGGLSGTEGLAGFTHGGRLSLDSWLLLQSVRKSFSVLPGQYYAFRLDPTARAVSDISPPNNLSELCLEAIQRAPRWLRVDLTDNLLQFGDMGFYPEVMADLILNTEDPYVDEVAFTIAHLSPSLFTGGQMSWDRDLQLVYENAWDVYAADRYLNYVRINDYGSSVDDNYWSTAEYAIRTPRGDTVQVQIDPELYYWYVVHPRISDEAPRYIDPLTGNVAYPPAGKFWRNFYLEEPDAGYRSLHDMLDSCDIMYGSLIDNSTDSNGAVGIVTRWIQDVMDFGSGAERPIQPVRIYHLHLGRCGEHQDITAAAGRAALIPTVGATAICNDHVWNEFWDGRGWKQWEPVNNYVGDSLSYQTWGLHFPAVFDWRGDGYVWSVTQRYHSNTTTLAVRILDALNNPVDGARVKVFSDYAYGGLQLATCGYTNSEGTVTFPIGGERNFYLNVSGPLGSYPASPNSGVLAVQNSSTDSVYEWTYNYGDTMAVLCPGQADSVAHPLNHFRLNLEYTMLNEAVHGQIFSYSDFVARIGAGRLDFFVCNEENYNRFVAGQDFQAFASRAMVDSGIVDFYLPDDGVYYAVVHNSNSVADYQRVSALVNFYMDSRLSNERQTATDRMSYALIGNYPNPFNSRTNIQFSLGRPGATSLIVYGIDGREVAREFLGHLNTGKHTAEVDCSRMASGVYLYRLESGEFKASAKMILLR